MGTSSHLVPAGMPSSGEPCSSSYTHPQIKHIHALKTTLSVTVSVTTKTLQSSKILKLLQIFCLQCVTNGNCASNLSPHEVSYINLPNVQNQISPLILSFGASDPVAATGIHADLASFAAMGCYGLPVMTAILTGDTSQIDDLHPLDGDLVDEQARTVLEDMQVLAFKIGQVGSVENVTVIAEIVSDYPELPLVLDPFNAALAEQGPEAEDLVLAIRELLIPQANLLMISAVELSRLAETWKDSSDTETETRADANVQTEDLADDVMTLIESGCEYILVTGTAGETGEVVNTLYNESGAVRRDAWQRLPGSHAGAGSTLSAAIAALLANGLEIPEAVLEAQEFTHAALSHSQRLGMGRLIPDRYFWARETEQTTL